MPVKHQIMIRFVGHEAQSHSTQHDTFKISKGMCEKAQNQVVNVLNNIRGECIHWPNYEELKEIAARMEMDFHIPNCPVPVMQDGTLLHLGIKPECDNAVDYYGRKCTYSITDNVINDNER